MKVSLENILALRLELRTLPPKQRKTGELVRRRRERNNEIRIKDLDKSRSRVYGIGKMGEGPKLELSEVRKGAKTVSAMIEISKNKTQQNKETKITEFLLRIFTLTGNI